VLDLIRALGDRGERVTRGTYAAVCPRAAESLSPGIVDRMVGINEGRRVVVVNKSDTWRVREGRRHDRELTAGFGRERAGVLGAEQKDDGGFCSISAGKNERMWG